MCQIIVAKAGKEVNIDKLDKAQVHNPDGYGVSWYEEGQINTFRTMKYDRLKDMVKILTNFTKIVHLRHTTCGATNIDNTHPFNITSGVMFHNGTISSLSGYNYKGKESDTSRLATLINACDFNDIGDIKPLLYPIIGSSINRLVFLEDTGEVTIMMESLGVTEDGIWYSNDYHKKPDWWSRTQTTKPYTPPKKAKGENWVKDPESKSGGFIRQKDLDARTLAAKQTGTIDKKDTPSLTKVFVYGTLKRGYSNNGLLKRATYLGKASTVAKWSMIGTNMAFPYLLKYDNAGGNHVIGEVYECDETTIKTLDTLEGVPNHYRIMTISVKYNDTKEEEVVKVYVKATQHEDWVKSSARITEWVK